MLDALVQGLQDEAKEAKDANNRATRKRRFT